MDRLRAITTTREREDSFADDTRKLLDQCRLDAEYANYLSQTPAKLDAILTNFIKFSSYNDSSKCLECLELIAVILNQRDGLCYLQNKFMLLHTTYKVLTAEESPKLVTQRALQVLFKLAECSDNLKYMFENDVLEFLYQICRSYESPSQNCRNMLKLCLHFIEKLLNGQQSQPGGDEISYRIADEHLILHQLGKNDPEIFSHALKILTLKKHLDFNVVKHSLEKLETRTDSGFDEQKLLILNYLYSIFSFPSCTRSVALALKFIQSTKIIIYSFPQETFDDAVQLKSIFRLTCEVLLKSNGDMENLPFYRELVVLTLNSGKLPSEVMSLCLQTAILLEHKICRERKPRNFYLFQPEEMNILVPALEIYQENYQVIVCVCETIFVICSSYNYDKTFKRFLMAKNVDLMLLKLAEKFQHYDYLQVLTSVLRAVRGLSDESLEIAYEFTNYNSLQKWAQIFKLYPQDPKFTLEVVLILDVWFQCNSTIHESLDYNIHELTLGILEHFCNDSPQMVFYTLNILSRYVSVFKSAGINAAKMLSPCIKALSVNLEKHEVQVKGLRLINSLALKIRKVEIRDETFMNYCHLLTNNLSEYKDNLQIKKEVFLSLKIYSDTNLYFYQFVIDFKIIDKILHSLEIHETLNSTDSELECLQKNFFLTLKKKCKGNILNEFLFLACFKNYGKSVVALVLLGADVNYEKNGESCLSRVVANKNLELTSFLLQNGATKDVETCLETVLKNENYQNRDEMIAIILSRHGTSRETGSVVWERLGLGNPKPEWFFKTFVTVFDQNSENCRENFQKNGLVKTNNGQNSRRNTGPFRRKLTPAHGMTYINPSSLPYQKQHSRSNTVNSETLMNGIAETRESVDESRNRIQSSTAGSGSEDNPVQGEWTLSSSESETSDLGSSHRGKELPVYPSFDDFIEMERMKADALNYFKFKTYHETSPSTSEREISYFSTDSQDIFGRFLTRAISTRTGNVVAEANSCRQPRHEALTGFQKYHRFKIETLALSENQITSLDSIAMSGKLTLCFASLKNFFLSRNKLSKLPASLMKNLTNLESLSLNENSFTEFPFEIFLCKKLEEVDLSHNFLAKFSDPESEKNNRSSSSMKILKVSSNQIKEWPEQFSKWFPEITDLNMEQNGLSKLPDLCIPSKIQILDFSSNKLKSIPMNFLSSFANLKQLSLRGNALTDLPEDSASLLTNLTVLDLSKNSLAIEKEPFIPNFILNLPWLRDLNISSNHLIGLPKPSFWKSKGLARLRCSFNQIESIDLSNDLTNFDQLTDLYLDYNALKAIPNEICYLKKLETLDVSHNPKIKRIPSDLYKCETLRRFYKLGLNLVNMPAFVQRGNTTALMKYLQERARNSTSYYAVKMLLMGHSGRGKTTILRKLIDNNYEPPENVPPQNSEPLGIEISQWTMKAIDRKSNKPADFSLNCWDFAGQEEFFATHQVFASTEALYMVFYNLAAENLNQELNLVSSWLYNIHARGPNAATIIVGTHVDLIQDENEETRRKHFCYEFFSDHFFSHTHRYTYAFVGLKSSDEAAATLSEKNSVANLRSLIRTKLAEFKIEGEYFMGRRIPLVYQNLEKAVINYKDRIKRDKTGIKSVIDSLTISNLIRKSKLDLSGHDIHLAMKFMNSTGTVLIFPDMIFSRAQPDIYFLDPQWLCSLMARILVSNPRAREIIRNSVITYEGLCIIYGPEITLLKIFIRLMEKFCILIPIDEQKWLIPNQLPRKHESYVSHMETLHNDYVIQRNYSMLFLPESLMPLFLAKIYSEKQDILPHESKLESKNVPKVPVTIDYFSDYVELCVLRDPVVASSIEVKKVWTSTELFCC